MLKRKTSIHIHAATLLAFGSLLAFLLQGSTAAQVSQTIPTRAYWNARELLLQGRYPDAEKRFQREVRGAIKTAQSRWIDSICYHTMLGETYFQRRENAKALEQFNHACEQFLAYPQWMLQVEFPALVPTRPNRRTVTPWGRTSRANITYGPKNSTMSINLGKVLTESDIARGGPIMRAQKWTINSAEIVRCTALAVSRRNMLLGALTPHDRLSERMAERLGRGTAPPNNWSGAWASLSQGIAEAGMGQREEARKHLTQATLASGKFEHSLTCFALLELGKLAMQAGDLPTAAKFFEEASYSAFYFEDLDIVEESLAYGARVHLMRGEKNIYPPLQNAAAWAGRKRWKKIQARLLLLAAEQYATLGKPAEAEAILKGDLQRILGKKDYRGSRLLARYHYLIAWNSFQLKRTKPAQAALQLMIVEGRLSGLWNFQISILNNGVDSGYFRPRIASDLYRTLLRDPNAVDWALDPMEPLAYLTTPHADAYDRWFDAALERKGAELAIEVADRSKRHRFLSVLPLGGRLFAIRQLLETSPQQLQGPLALQRQELLLHTPEYEPLLAKAHQLRRELSQKPLDSEEPKEVKSISKKFRDWNRTIEERESLLAEIAFSPRAADLLFPPVMTTNEIQARLPQGGAMLVFHARGDRLYGFLISSKDYAAWEVGSRKKVFSAVATLLKGFGIVDGNRPISEETLASDAWKKASVKAWQAILSKARFDIASTEQLIIIPDDSLWYLPFEALATGTEEKPALLLTHTQVRYAPLASIAIQEGQPRKPVSKTAIAPGKLFLKADDELTQELVESISESLPGAFTLPAKPLGPPRLYADLAQLLIVLGEAEIQPEEPFAWSPISTAGKTGKETLGMWLLPPNSGPQTVLLPAARTPAESGLRRRSKQRLGHELFITLCTLHAHGTQTVLISRWRTGGKTSVDLMREFAKELPETSASEAWQRSILLMMDSPINSTKEPRIKNLGEKELQAKHPFFWAGYLLSERPAKKRAGK